MAKIAISTPLKFCSILSKQPILTQISELCRYSSLVQNSGNKKIGKTILRGLEIAILALLYMYLQSGFDPFIAILAKKNISNRVLTTKYGLSGPN